MLSPVTALVALGAAIAIATVAHATPLSERQVAPAATEVVPFHVQGVYFVESDMPHSDEQERAVREQVYAVQSMWLDNFGATFPIADPAVKVVRGLHDQFWYLNTKKGEDEHFYRMENMAPEIKEELGYTPTTPVRVLMFPASTHNGKTVGFPGPKDGFGGAFMDGDDIQCVIDKTSTMPYSDHPAASCIGHIAHEFGHAFGLDHTGSSNDCMVATGLYDVKKDCIFSDANRQKVITTESNWLTLTSVEGDVSPPLTEEAVEPEVSESPTAVEAVEVEPLSPQEMESASTSETEVASVEPDYSSSEGACSCLQNGKDCDAGLAALGGCDPGTVTLKQPYECIVLCCEWCKTNSEEADCTRPRIAALCGLV